MVRVECHGRVLNEEDEKRLVGKGRILYFSSRRMGVWCGFVLRAAPVPFVHCPYDQAYAFRPDNVIVIMTKNSHKAIVRCPFLVYEVDAEHKAYSYKTRPNSFRLATRLGRVP